MSGGLEDSACLVCGLRVGEFGPATMRHNNGLGATHAGKCTILYLAFSGELNLLRQYLDQLIEQHNLEEPIR